MWVLAWVVITPAFLYAAYRIGYADEDDAVDAAIGDPPTNAGDVR